MVTVEEIRKEVHKAARIMDMHMETCPDLSTMLYALQLEVKDLLETLEGMYDNIEEVV